MSFHMEPGQTATARELEDLVEKLSTYDMGGSQWLIAARDLADRIGLGETVTWKARHFGITWKMTSKITELDEPNRFVDEQLRGPFKRFHHEHAFTDDPVGCRMVDRIVFGAPFGPLGDLVERLVLGSYLPKLINERNHFLRDQLERT